MKEEKQYSCLYIKNGKRTCEEKFGCDGNGKILIHFPNLRFTEEKNCEKYVRDPAFDYQQIFEGIKIQEDGK